MLPRGSVIMVTELSGTMVPIAEPTARQGSRCVRLQPLDRLSGEMDFLFGRPWVIDNGDAEIFSAHGLKLKRLSDSDHPSPRSRS